MEQKNRMGPAQGQGSSMGSGGAGRGQGGRFRAGPGGNCVCPNCGETMKHKRAMPCLKQKCPKCGTAMARE